MKLLRHSSRRSRRGASAVEIVLAGIVLALLMGAIAETVLRGTEAYKQGMSAAMLEGQARRLLDRIATEFADVDRSSLAPNPLAPFGAATVSYQRCIGWAAGSMVLSPVRQIQLALDTGEADNGVDDNGNGLIDERSVVLVPDTTAPAETVGWGRWVRELAEGELQNGADDNGNGLTDERGLFFLHDGNGTLTIGLTLERLDPEGRPIAFSARTAVRMRND